MQGSSVCAQINEDISNHVLSDHIRTIVQNLLELTFGYAVAEVYNPLGAGDRLLLDCAVIKLVLLYHVLPMSNC